MAVSGVRTGIGFDFHRLVRGRKLVLGGVTVPFHRGLEGHSDADVLLHAVCDALLGAAGLADIGHYFPNTDLRFKDVSSLLLLGEVAALVENAGYAVENIDVMLLIEAPRIGPYRDRMREEIARCLRLPLSGISIKATTLEGCGPVGRGEGVAAQAVATLRRASTRRKSTQRRAQGSPRPRTPKATRKRATDGKVGRPSTGRG